MNIVAAEGLDGEKGVKAQTLSGVIRTKGMC